ncbi:hypothetical protein [Streptomyces sp. NPDC005953]
MPEHSTSSVRTWHLWLALYVASSLVVGLAVSLVVSGRALTPLLSF